MENNKHLISYTFLLNKEGLEKYKFVRAIENNIFNSQDLLHDLVGKLNSTDHPCVDLMYQIFKSVDSLNIDWSTTGWCDLNFDLREDKTSSVFSIYGLDHVLMCNGNVDNKTKESEINWTVFDGYGMVPLDSMESVIETINEYFTFYPESMYASELVRSTYVDLKNMIDMKTNMHLDNLNVIAEENIPYDMLPTLKLEYYDTQDYQFLWNGYPVWNSETDTLESLEKGESTCDLFYQSTMYDVILNRIFQFNLLNYISI